MKRRMDIHVHPPKVQPRADDVLCSSVPCNLPGPPCQPQGHGAATGLSWQLGLAHPSGASREAVGKVNVPAPKPGAAGSEKSCPVSTHPALLSWHRALPPCLPWCCPCSHDPHPAHEPLVPLQVEDATSFHSFQTNYTETRGEMHFTRNATKPVGPPARGMRWELLMARIQEPASHSSCSTAGATRQKITNISPALVMGLAAKGNLQVRNSCWVVQAPGCGEELQSQFAPSVSTAWYWETHLLHTPGTALGSPLLPSNFISLPPFPRNYMAAANSF